MMGGSFLVSSLVSLEEVFNLKQQVTSQFNVFNSEVNSFTHGDNESLQSDRKGRN